jgi:hypothetical protein
VDVEVDGKLSSPFTAATIDTLSIRGNWLRNAQPGSKAKVVTVNAGLTTLDVGGVHLEYGAEGLHQA